MDKGIIQFQSLSRCEAEQMCHAITNTILNAYITGLNVVANNYDKPLDDLFTAHRDALIDLGFSNISFKEAISMIEFSVKEEI